MEGCPKEEEGVVGVLQAGSQVGAVDKFVDEEYMVGGDARDDELDD